MLYVNKISLLRDLKLYFALYIKRQDFQYSENLVFYFK